MLRRLRILFLLTTILAAQMAVGLPTGQAGSLPAIELVVDKPAAIVGDIVTLTIWAKNFTSEAVFRSLAMSVSFDNTALRPLKTTVSGVTDFFESGANGSGMVPKKSVDASKGLISLEGSFLGTDYFVGDGTVGTVQFEVLKMGDHSLRFVNYDEISRIPIAVATAAAPSTSHVLSEDEYGYLEATISVTDLTPAVSIAVSELAEQTPVNVAGEAGVKVNVVTLPLTGTVTVVEGTTLSESRLFVNPTFIDLPGMIVVWDSGTRLTGSEISTTVDLSQTANRPNKLLLGAKVTCGDQTLYGISEPLHVLPDTIAPQVLNLQLNDGDAATSDRNITVSFQVQDTDAAKMRVAASPEVLTNANWTDIDSDFQYELAAGPDGSRTVYLEVCDDIGNPSNPVSASINLITALIGGTVDINDGELYTNSSQVELAIAAPEFADEMIIGDDSQFTDSSWQAIDDPVTYTLTGEDGLKTVYAKFRHSGLDLASTVASDSITLDTKAPEVEVEGVNDGDTAASFDISFNVVDVNLDDQLTVTTLKKGEGDALPFSGGTVSEAGTYVLEILARDLAGNTSTVTRDFTVNTDVPKITITGTANGQSYRSSVAPAVSVADGTITDMTMKHGEDAIQWQSGQTLSDDGIYTLVVNAKNSVNGLTSSVTQIFTIDTVRPDATVSVADMTLTKDDVILTFSATDNNEGATIDDATLKTGEGAALPVSSGTTISDDGEYTLTLNVIDRAGNTASKTIRFEVDQKVPDITVNGVSDGKTAAQFSISFNAADKNLDGQAAATLKKGTANAEPFTGGTVTEPGVYQLVVTAEDLAGNTAASTINFTVDTNVPTISFTGVQEGVFYAQAVTPGTNVTHGEITETSLKLNGVEIPNWSLGQELSTDGAYVLEVEAVNPANQLTATEHISFTVDQSDPIITITAVEDGDSYDGAVTPDIGITEANLDTKTVALTCGGQPVQYESGPITADGAYILTVTVSDKAGNETTESISFTIDTVDPGATVNVADSTLTNADVTLSFSATDNNEGAIVDATLQLGEDAAQPVSSGTTVSDDGEYTLVLHVTDRAGNAVTKTVGFEIDQTEPVITVNGVQDGKTAAQFSISFSAADKNLDGQATATLKKGTANAQPFAGGMVTEPDVYQLVINANDLAGNATTKTIDFTVDTNVPTISFTGVQDGEFYAYAVTPGVNVNLGQVDEVSLEPETPGWSLGQSLSSDECYVLTVTAVNPANELTATETVSFTIDQTEPEITIDEVEGGHYYGGTVTPAINVTETNLNNQAVSLTCGGDPVQYESGPITADGDYVLTVTVSDKAGNDATESVAFTIDTRGPEIEVTGVTNGGLYKEVVTPGAIVTELNIDTQEEVLTYNDVEVDAVSADGTYVFTVTVKDKAGHEATSVVTFTLDRTAPMPTVEYTTTDPTNDDVTATISFDEENVTVTNNNGSFDYTFEQNGEFTFEFTDAAGNTGTVKAIVGNIDKQAPDAPTNLGCSVEYINLANRQSIAVSGGAEAGSTVEVVFTDGQQGSVSDSATADENGSFSLTVDVSSLEDGTITVSATATDAVGNSGGASTITLPKDTAPPSKPTEIAVGGDVINLSNRQTVVVAGKAETGARVSVELTSGTGRVAADPVTADAQGAFSATVDATVLNDGEVQVTTVATDQYGNSSEAATIIVTKDTVAPNVLAVFSPQMNKTLRAGLPFAWNAIVDSTGTVKYRIKQGDTEIVSATDMTKAGSMYTGSYVAAALGEVQLNGEVWMVDEAGNTSVSKAFRFNVDSVAPSITSVSHVLGKDVYKAGDELRVTVVAGEANAVVTVDIGTLWIGLRASGQGETYTLSFLVPAGANAKDLQVKATIKDAAGNTDAANDPVRVAFDSLAPTSRATITGTVNAKGYYTVVPKVVFKVSEAADLTYRLGSAQAITIPAAELTLADGLYVSEPVELPEGEYDLTFNAADAAGNREADKLHQGIKVDTVAPTVTVEIDEDKVDRDSKTVVVNGTSEAGATVTLYRRLGNGSLIRLAGGIAAETGVWTANAELLSGNNVLVAVAKDVAGNVSAEATDSYVLDTQGPIFTIVVNDTTGTISITSSEAVAEDTLQYDLKVDGVLDTEFALNETVDNTAWSGHLPDGASYDFVIEGEDLFGNLGIGVYCVNNVNAATGDTVGSEHVIVFIAPNALKTDQSISVTSNDGNPEQFEDEGNTVTGTADYRPDGTEFDVPAQITMPIDPSVTDENKVVVFYINAQGGLEDLTSRIISVDLVNHTVTFEVDHFCTIGTGADFTPPSLGLVAPVAGAITNEDTVAVTGTTDGCKVTLIVNDVEQETKEVANGEFSFSAQLIHDQANEIAVRAVDQANNEVTETITVIQDGTRPTVDFMAPALGSATRDASIDVTVRVADDNLRSLTVNGTELLLAAGQHDKTIAVTLPQEGSNEIAAIAVDRAGNEQTVTLSVIKDTACQLTVSSPVNGDVTPSSTVDVIGTTDPGAKVSVDNLFDQLAAFTAVAGQDGAYSVQVTLVANDNDLTVSAEDSLHNQSSTISLSVERNDDVPAVTILPITTPTKATTITVSATVTSPTDLVSITYAAPSGSGVMTKGQDGSYSASISLDEGENNITVVAVNEAGAGQASTTVVSDNTAPTIALTAPTAGQTISTQTTVVSGSLSEAGTVQISVGGSNHNLTASGAEHSFSQQVTLVRGQNTITITASDALGNSSTETVNVDCTYLPADSGSGSGGSTPPVQTHDKEIKPTELTKSSKTETSAAGQTVTTTITVTDTLLQQAANNAKTQGQPVVLTLPTVEQANDPQTTADGKPITRLAKLTLSDAQVGTVAGTGLSVQGPNGTLVQLPQALLNALAAANTGLELAISRVPNEVAQSALGDGDEALFAQEIGTNFSGRTTLRFLAPEGVDVTDLKMHVKHSDGTEEDIVPVAVTGADGKTYLEIAVDRFSTFILYKAAKPVEPPVTPTKKTIVLTVGKQGASIDGKAYQMDAAPYVQANTGRTLVPIRFVTEAIGAKVEWLAATKQVRITDGDTVILLTIGSKTATVNGKTVTIDAPATLTGSRTFVPLRFISETLGADVIYAAATKSITITR